MISHCIYIEKQIGFFCYIIFITREVFVDNKQLSPNMFDALCCMFSKESLT